MSDEPKLSKVARLRIGGVVAPKLRKAKGSGRDRRVAVVDGAGRIVGYRNWTDVQRALLKRVEIEFSVQDGVRPETVLCEVCNAVVKVSRRGGIPRRCAGLCSARCGGCGKQAPGHVFQPSAVASRGGAPWRCKGCATAARHAAMAPDQRSERARKISAAVAARNAAMTHDQRSEVKRKAWATRRARAEAAQ